ncbi:DUF2169 family type VI secretion system accessory protein [Vibrio sp. WXL103]|uniref:DUF2169 family type VI secretion system accessory protein n=1 Tax=Vibrio sp. WXL103 TaxID=3450710 RepID=UPI003EC51A8B
MQLWQIDSELAHITHGQFRKDATGKNHWILNMRQDWLLDGDALTLSSEQGEPAATTVYTGEPGESSIEQESDFVTFKPNTDIVITGSVRSPSKVYASSLIAQLMVEPHINKTIKFFGPRRWVTHAGQISVSTAEKINQSQISYQSAIGGESNKVGTGVADSDNQLVQMPVPSQFLPDQDWLPKTRGLIPASFEPIAPYMPWRSEFGGTFDQTWLDEVYPLMPADFDTRFNQQAPPDQQWKGRLEGGERIVLAGFFEQGPVEFVLPRQQFIARVKLQHEHNDLVMQPYTLSINTDQNLVSLIWHAAFECHQKETELVGAQIFAASSATLIEEASV